MTMNDDGDDGAGPHCSGALVFGGFDDAGAKTWRGRTSSIGGESDVERSVL